MAFPRKTPELHALHQTRPEYDVDQVPEGQECIAADLDPPASLSEPAAAHFRRLTGLVDAIGMLTEQDVDAIGILADTLAQIDACREAVAERGQLIGDKRNPCAAALPGLNNQATGLLHKLGLTPGGRANGRIPQERAPSDPKASKAAKMFGG